MKYLGIAVLGLFLASCSTTGQYQPLPPVKVITETVEVEIYAPPLPKEINLADIEWKVITNTPCKPATGKKTISNNKFYYTTERFAYETYINEEGEERRRVQRDADGNRVELEPLVDNAGDVIQSCGNIQQKIAEIEVMLDGDFVIFAVTPEGYERMAANLQEIKRYIGQQKEIIYYYREATAPKGKEGWLEKNKQQQDNDVEEKQAEAEQEVQQEEPSFNLNNLFNRGKKDD